MSSSKHIPKEIRKKIADERKGGALVSEIREKYGVSKDTVTRISKEYGIVVPRKNGPKKMIASSKKKPRSVAKKKAKPAPKSAPAKMRKEPEKRSVLVEFELRDRLAKRGIKML